VLLVKLVDCGLISDKNRWFFVKLAWIFDWRFIFEWKNVVDRVHRSWTVVALVHDGARIEEAAVAHRSSCSRLVWATAAHHDMVKMERGVRRC
jgi:hypothetical protein